MEALISNTTSRTSVTGRTGFTITGLLLLSPLLLLLLSLLLLLLVSLLLLLPSGVGLVSSGGAAALNKIKIEH